MLGKPCSLEFTSEPDGRRVNGIVRRFERVGQGNALTHYQVLVVPLHWLLTKRTNSRVFQKPRTPDMRVEGIVRQVLQDAGVPEHAFKFALSRKYAEREFVVQYRESDFDFIARLLEEEGLFFFFEHTRNDHRMIIADSAVAYRMIGGDGKLPYRDPQGMVPEREFVFDLRDAHETQSGAVSLDEFDFKRPTAPLKTLAKDGAFPTLQLTDYPGGYVDRNRGDRLTSDWLAAQQCAARVVEIATTARDLLPGYTFTLSDHPQHALNREYVVTQITHRATQPQSAAEESGVAEGARYEASARVIPRKIEYRPPRHTPKPIVTGSQTALVVGPDNEEIHTDQYGRVRVQFHWDHLGQYDEHSSCWLRVSHGFAGAGFGMMFLPRVGQEVLVEFLEGDPDRPIITGRVYNNDHMPPYALPQHKTRSTIRTCSSPGGGGANEIRFEDAQGAEHLLLFAQRDLHQSATHDRFDETGRDHHSLVTGKHVEQVKQSRHTRVDLDLIERIGGKHLRTVVGDRGEVVRGNHHQDVTGNSYLHGKNIVIEADTSLSLKVGGNFVTINQTGVTVLGQTVNINSGGSARQGHPVPVAEPEQAQHAEKTAFGRHVRYQQDPSQPDGLRVAQLQPRPATTDQPQTDTSWIEIELVDELGAPVPGVRYEVRSPHGALRRGVLDDAGFARVSVPTPGECEVCFPNLDAATWEKI